MAAGGHRQLRIHVAAVDVAQLRGSKTRHASIRALFLTPHQSGFVARKGSMPQLAQPPAKAFFVKNRLSREPGSENGSGVNAQKRRRRKKKNGVGTKKTGVNKKKNGGPDTKKTRVDTKKGGSDTKNRGVDAKKKGRAIQNKGAETKKRGSMRNKYRVLAEI